MRHVIGSKMIKRLVLLASVPLLAAAAAAAPRPAALAPVAGGLWEVSRSATGAGARRVCVTDPLRLAMTEHQGAQCTSAIVGQGPNSATVHYTCIAGGYGQARVTVITPRALRIQVQGISGNYPFDYVIHARRLGDCRR